MKHIWFITGPAGCGKSTVGEHVASVLHLPYVEGDQFHPPANVEKMAQGHALTDSDRWSWLLLLRTQGLARLASESVSRVVLACSALKRAYRDVLRAIPEPAQDGNRPFDVQVHFIYLQASEAVLLQRVNARQGHYMKAGMVESQVEVLEEPGPEESGDCVTLDVGKEKDIVLNEALAIVRGVLPQG